MYQLVVWFFFLFLLCFLFFTLPLSLSPGPVRHYYMLNIVTKINKWTVDVHQGELYIYKASLGKANLFGIKGIQITILLP